MKSRRDKDPELEQVGKSQEQRLEERALRALKDAFKADQWKVSRDRQRAEGYDMRCEKAGRAYIIEVKAAAGRARRSQLQGRLADAILRARNHAARHDGQPIAIVVAPSISSAIARELKEYVQRFGNGIAWGAIDERGRFDLHGPDLDEVQPVKQPMLFDNPAPARSDVSSEAHNPYSDLGQWMLKVLLSSKVPDRWLNAPRSPISGVSDLAKNADVSPSSASRFIAGLEQSGHVMRSGAGIQLVRIEALKRAWFAESQRPAKERFVRFLIPSPDPLKKLRNVLADYSRRHPSLFNVDFQAGSPMPSGPVGKRACLALFSASDALGVGFVRGAPVHMYAESLAPAFLKELELQAVLHRADADLVARQPRFPESIFRGLVHVDGIPVADLLQCWIDVALHPARGAEQAAEIERHLKFSEWEA